LVKLSNGATSVADALFDGAGIRTRFEERFNSIGRQGWLASLSSVDPRFTHDGAGEAEARSADPGHMGHLAGHTFTGKPLPKFLPN
jgi:hypothetical protein